MKKALLVSVVLFATSFAHAQLSSQCEYLIRDASKQGHLVNAAIADGSLSANEIEFFQINTKNMAQSAVNTCVGLEEIRIQRSFRGRVGLISESEIESRIAAVAQEATDLYNSLAK